MSKFYRSLLSACIILFSAGIIKAQCPINNQSPTINPSTICGSGTATVSIPSSQLGVTYALVTGTVIVSGPTAGTGSALNFTTGTVTVTTTYSVMATNGTCTVTMTPDVTVTVTPGPTVTVAATKTLDCSGHADTLTASGASTYTWMPGGANGATHIVNPNTTTNYTVTGTDINGCTGTVVQTISVTPSPTITITTTPLGGICAGASATLTASGAISYTWSANAGGATTNSVVVSPTVTTVYAVAGSNGTCTSVRTRTVTVNPTATVTINGPAFVCMGSTATLTASGATNYTWSTGATTTSITVSPTVTTTYSVVGSGFGTCPGSASFTLNVSSNPPPTVTISGSTVTCMGQPDVLTANGATTYTWSANAGGATTATVAPSPTVNTTYSVVGTDNNGCTGLGTFSVTVKPLPVVTTNSPAMCIGATTTLTASGASTYSWSPPTDLSATTGASVTANPTVTTTYTVTGTSASGCTNTATATVTVHPLPSLSVTPATICNPGTATLTCNPSTLPSYTWSPGLSSTNGPSVTGSPTVTTNYTVSATDANGCVGTTVATINVVSSLTVTASPSSTAACIGSSVTLTGLGAASYTWANSAGSMSGNTGTTVTVTPAGSSTTYSVTGSSGSCSNGPYTLTITVNPLPVVTASASPNDSICTGSSVTLNGSGAISYSWTNGVTDGVAFTPTTTATYTVTGTDTNGCKNTAAQKVTLNPLPTVTITPSPGGFICPGQTVTLTASGAASYVWSANAGSATTNTVAISPAVTTSYTVTGMSALGCTNTAVRNENVRIPPTITITGQNSFCGAATTTLTASGASTYTWSTGVNTPSITVSPTVTTTYTVVGTGTNVCTTTVVDTVKINTPPTVMANATSTLVCSGSSVTLTGSGAASYTWSGGVTDGAAFAPSATQQYTVTGSDANGCTGSDTITITVQSCTGINSIGLAQSASIYPNPSKGVVNISMNLSGQSYLDIKIVNMSGEVVYHELVGSVNGAITKTLNLSDLSKGIYFVRVGTDKEIVMKKVVLQ